MESTALTPAQRHVFERACQRRGLHPEGFDVRALGTGTQPLYTLIIVGGREYRFPYLENDDSWAETFFRELNKVGDSGDGVESASSEEERSES